MKWLNGIIDKVKKSLAVKCNIHWIKKHKKELREKYGGKSIIVQGSVWYEVPNMKLNFEQHIIDIKYER